MGNQHSTALLAGKVPNAVLAAIADINPDKLKKAKALAGDSVSYFSSAEELMERFKRGDESRNTEGSGLGLAIAKDLVKLMNGIFEITVDGDLFKATVMLEKAEENQQKKTE